MKQGTGLKTARSILLTVLSLSLLGSGLMGCTDSNNQKAAKENSAKTHPSDKKGVSFTNLEDGQTLKLPATVKFEAHGMKTAQAGKGDLSEKNAGHHHIIIDKGPVAQGEKIPSDKHHRHFGGGETQAQLKDLEPGKHQLTLQFADGVHRSYGKKWSDTITVHVKE